MHSSRMADKLGKILGDNEKERAASTKKTAVTDDPFLLEITYLVYWMGDRHTKWIPL